MSWGSSHGSWVRVSQPSLDGCGGSTGTGRHAYGEKRGWHDMTISKKITFLRFVVCSANVNLHIYAFLPPLAICFRACLAWLVGCLLTPYLQRCQYGSPLASPSSCCTIRYPYLSVNSSLVTRCPLPGEESFHTPLLYRALCIYLSMRQAFGGHVAGDVCIPLHRQGPFQRRQPGGAWPTRGPRHQVRHTPFRPAWVPVYL